MADDIIYGEEIWKEDAAAALAEATRRVEIGQAQGSDWLFLSDLYALETLPENLAGYEGLKRLSVGGFTKGPDGRSYNEFHKRALADLAVISGITTLTRLDLSFTSVADLAPIAGCTALQTLDCSSTEVSDLTPIAGCSALQALICNGTKISDLAPIAGCTALQALNCSSTKISDLTPIAGCSALQALNCSSTKISDLAPIAGCSALQALNCSSTKISDLAPIAGCTALQALNCSSTKISDLAPIAGCSALQALDCYNTQISDLTPIAGCTALQALNCHDTQISDLTPIAGCSALRTLDCYNTQISDLTPIAGCTALQTLNCYNTQISDLAPIAGCTALQWLNCHDTQISDLAPIAGCTALQTLNCYNTQISDLTPIAGCTALQTLNCSSTQISNLTPIAGCTALQTLNCSSTQISDLTPIAGCTALQMLDCRSTQISDLAPIAELPEFLEKNASLTFTNTPAAARDARWQEIAALGEHFPTRACADAAVERVLEERGEAQPTPLPDASYLFLSYAAENRERVRLLHQALRDDGVPIWWDQALEIGARFRATIEEKVDGAGAVLVAWTPEALTSDFVLSEAQRGQKADKLLPVQLSACDLPMAFDQIQTPSLIDWEGDRENPTYQRILRQIRRTLGQIETGGPEMQALAMRHAGFETKIGTDGRASLVQYPADKPLPMDESPSLQAEVADQRDAVDAVLAPLSRLDTNTAVELNERLRAYLEAIEEDKPRLGRVQPRWTLLSGFMSDELTRSSLDDGITGLFNDIKQRHPKIIEAIDKTPDDPPPAPEINPGAVSPDDAVEIGEAFAASFDTHGEEAALDASFAETARAHTDVLRATRDAPYGETPKQEGRRKAEYKRAMLALAGVLGAAGSLSSLTGFTARGAYTALSDKIAPLFERLAAIFF